MGLVDEQRTSLCCIVDMRCGACGRAASSLRGADPEPAELVRVATTVAASSDDCLSGAEPEPDELVRLARAVVASSPLPPVSGGASTDSAMSTQAKGKRWRDKQDRRSTLRSQPRRDWNLASRPGRDNTHARFRAVDGARRPSPARRGGGRRNHQRLRLGLAARRHCCAWTVNACEQPCNKVRDRPRAEPVGRPRTLPIPTACGATLSVLP